MAWMCKRAIAGLQYTPLEFDQPEDYGREPWMAFLEGRDLLRPAGWLSSATQVRATSGRLPDVFTERTHHLCNQRFKELVEELEPGIHFFKPILLKRKNGDAIGDHFLWTVGQDIDCVLTQGVDAFRDPETDRMRVYNAEDAARHAYKDGKPPVLRISARATRGKHLWYGGLIGLNTEPRIFVSDEFQARWTSGKFSQLDFLCPVDEVDVAWDPVENMGPEIAKWREREAMIAKCWPKEPRRH